MSCLTPKQLDESLKHSTIAKLLLDGKLYDSRPPPIDLSVRKSPNNGCPFGVRKLLGNSQGKCTQFRQNESTINEKLLQPQSCDLNQQEKAGFDEGHVYGVVPNPESQNVIIPDSVTDSAAKFPVSPFIVINRPRTQRSSNALRSLLMRPSSLMQTKLKSRDNDLNNNNNNNDQNIQLKNENRLQEISEKCRLAEFTKYLCGREKFLPEVCDIATLHARHWYSYNNDGCKEDDSNKCSLPLRCAFSSFPIEIVKREQESDPTPLRKEEGDQVKEVNRRRGNDVAGCSNNGKVQHAGRPLNVTSKCKRKIKSESPESSSYSNSTPEPLVNSATDEKRNFSSLLKLPFSYLASPVESDQAIESKDDLVLGSNECDYDTFRKFKRFRKCLPASLPDVPRGCECNLKKNLIQEVNSTSDKKLPSVDAGTQCFIRDSLRSSVEASTQCNFPANLATGKFELEAENRVTEGISMSSEVVLKCFHCGVTFEDDVIYSIHMGCHCHRDPFICNLCGRQCGNKYVFNTHILRGHQSP